MLQISGVAATVIMTVVGAFGTGAMPAPARAAFWALLIGWNIAKWQAWFMWRVRSRPDWSRAAMSGAVVLNLPLPLEITGALALFGIGHAPNLGRAWLEAGLISAAIFLVVMVLRRPPHTTAGPPTIVPDGVLARAGLRDAGMLAAIVAEDHYCRLHLADGGSRLIHARFGDALAETATFEGARIHRGAWVADHAVAGARRIGRRWHVAVAGSELAISPPYLAAARARGWLRRISPGNTLPTRA